MEFQTKDRKTGGFKLMKFYCVRFTSRQIILALFLTLGLTLFFSIHSSLAENRTDAPSPAFSGMALPLFPVRNLSGYSAWIPEWAMSMALREANAQREGLESVQIFAVYFDKDDILFLSEQMTHWLGEEFDRFSGTFTQMEGGRRIPLYLSVVNDVYDKRGTSFKDPDIVSRLLRTKEARNAHIDALLGLLDRWPFDGLEIDYERVKQEDWRIFLSFCRDLHEKLEARGKSLRVVLEPQKKYFSEKFPSGPEYVIMAYNLFGTHSEPGPKAAPRFIKEIASWAETMDVMPRLALATGGFLWDMNTKQVRGITESEANLTMQREGAVPKRDEESGYLVFQFPPNSSAPQIVWFADGETLAFLVSSAKQSGFKDFALWRFAGNRIFSLNTWKTEVLQ
jgi:hypothetical protein